jgi:nucleoid-associated protein YgaU
VVPSQEQVAVVVKPNKAPAIIAKVTPDQPVAIATPPEKRAPATVVELSAVDYDTAGNIQFQGRVAAGGIVRFYVDNAPVGETVADAKGQWNFKSATAIAPGPHTLRADEVSPAGKVLSRVEQPFLREEPEKLVAVAAPAVDAAAPAIDQPNRIVIQPGQNLWRISREVYGKGKLFTVIYEANKALIKDPAKIYPGQILTAPKS